MSDVAALANDLHRALKRGAGIERLLKTRGGWLVRQVRRDAQRPGLFSLWGQSLNVDENTGTIIVPVPVIDALSSLAGIPAEHPVVHAGIAHTYGYLLSQIETPYGLKRDRWVKAQIESITGLPPRTLRPHPCEGTLFANATYFLGRIAFRNRPRELRELRRLRDGVSPDLHSYGYRWLRWTRITERVRLSGHRIVELHTDLLPSCSSSGAFAGESLLIYWITDSASRRASLITTFPVSADVTERLLAPERFGSNVEIRARYNAFVPNLTGRTVRGRRETSSIRASAGARRP